MSNMFLYIILFIVNFIFKANVKSTLKDIHKCWPQFDIDGMKNIWILKPGNKCRGRGIQLVKRIIDVEKVMGLKAKYVVQKYIGNNVLLVFF